MNHDKNKSFVMKNKKNLKQVPAQSLRADREGWWFEHFVSWLRVCLSVAGTKNVSWPGLYALRG